jgi:uncharacterized membrane protein YuzA (DUF378 family)
MSDSNVLPIVTFIFMIIGAIILAYGLFSINQIAIILGAVTFLLGCFFLVIGEKSE